MSKISFTTLVAVVLVAGLAYLAFNPDVLQDASNWLRNQFRGGPDPKTFSAPSYTPVIPGR